ncbi:MAG: hypothetical protein HOP10_05935 [Chitinophagaceae bacterium]|nr:hypothetical protein [Chitinophagaceae bacterium]
MKKLVVVIALACYLVVSTGVVINYHYCMKRLASTQLFGSTKAYCDNCGMHVKRSNGCCHDQVKVLKLSTDQNTFSAIAHSIPAPDVLAITPSEFIAALFYNINEQKHFHNHSPPLLSARDTYLRINVFRI